MIIRRSHKHMCDRRSPVAGNDTRSRKWPEATQINVRFANRALMSSGIDNQDIHRLWQSSLSPPLLQTKKIPSPLPFQDTMTRLAAPLRLRQFVP